MISAPLVLVLFLSLVQQPKFREEVIEKDSGGAGYNSCLADINGDGKIDIVLVTEKQDQVIWYENPMWKRHVMTTGTPKSPEPLTPFDVDGDGKPELIVGGDWLLNDTLTSGSLWLLKRPDDLEKPWTPIKIDQEPSMHRLAVMTVDGKKTLVASSLLGKGTKPPDFEGPGAALYLLRPEGDPFTSTWKRELISDELHRVHGVYPYDWDGDGVQDLMTASAEGVHVFKRGAAGWTKQKIADGAPGASEIRVFTLNGKRALATIEPFHGGMVAVYAPERKVILEGYTTGHGVIPVDFRGKGVESLLCGFRGEKGKGGWAVVVMHPAADGWEKQVVDDTIEADGVHAADFNGDGRIDIVATGKGSTIKIYWNDGP